MSSSLGPSSSGSLALDPFGHPTYLLRRTFFRFLGASFRIFDPVGRLAFYSKQKAFRLKEDIRVYADEEMGRELLTIGARQVLDIGATYDVRDARTGEKVGALRRRGLRSFVRDEWTILGDGDRELGTIQEDSLGLALLRRLLTNLVPQSFHGHVGGEPVLHFRQHFNPFVQKLDLDFSSDRVRRLDRRLGIAAAILICTIEGRQG